MNVDFCYMEVASVRGVLWVLSNMKTHGSDLCSRFISFSGVFLLYENQILFCLYFDLFYKMQ